jgi:hypothetical protein
MPHMLDLWSETIGLLVAILLLPFYIGYLHLTLAQLLAYIVVAGAVLTAADHLRFASAKPVGAADLAMDFTLWAQAVLGLGLAAYLLALVLV